MFSFRNIKYIINLSRNIYCNFLRVRTSAERTKRTDKTRDLLSNLVGKYTRKWEGGKGV